MHIHCEPIRKYTLYKLMSLYNEKTDKVANKSINNPMIGICS